MAGEQRGQMLGIEVVGMLVGDQDRVEIGQPVPGVGEVAGVDQDPRRARFDQHGGMPEMSDLHESDPSGQPAGGSADQVSDDRPGLGALGGGDVEVGHGAEHERAQRGNGDALLGRGRAIGAAG